MTFLTFSDLPTTSKSAKDNGWTKITSCGGWYCLCYILIDDALTQSYNLGEIIEFRQLQFRYDDSISTNYSGQILNMQRSLMRGTALYSVVDQNSGGTLLLNLKRLY